MKLGSTLFLRSVIFLFGLFVLFLCVYVLPRGILSENAGPYRMLLLYMYLPALPFFFALFQGFRLLTLIDQNKVFSGQSVQALQIIKYSGLSISILYIVVMPYIFSLAQMDDAPGVAALGFIFIFSSLVVSAAAAVFQNLLQNVITIKSENELTV